MEARQKRVLQALRRVQDFLDEHTPVKQPVNYVAQRKSLDDVVTQLETNAVKQDLGGRRLTGDTRRQRSLRAQLVRKHMRPIARIARALLSDVPGFEKDLKLPPARIDSEGLISVAQSMKEAATPYKVVFIENGRADDFLEQLGAAADAVKDSIDSRSANGRSRTGATAGMKDVLAQARKTVNQLNAMLLPEIEDNRELVAKWRAAKRIAGGPLGTTTATPGTTATTPSEPTPVAA